MQDAFFQLLSQHLDTIIITIGTIIVGFIYKDKTDEADAVKSIRTGVAHFFQNHPEVKNILADGKIDSKEWAYIFQQVGPVAASAATKGGAKVLKRWSGPVANKYIEAVAREIAVEFSDVPADVTVSKGTKIEVE